MYLLTSGKPGLVGGDGRSSVSIWQVPSTIWHILSDLAFFTQYSTTGCLNLIYLAFYLAYSDNIWLILLYWQPCHLSGVIWKPTNSSHTITTASVSDFSHLLPSVEVKCTDFASGKILSLAFYQHFLVITFIQE